jgi:hypothetical protein
LIEEDDDINIDDIISELGFSKEEKTEVISKVKSGEIDVEDLSSVAEGLVDMVKSDRVKADEIFDLFYADLAQKTDRSQASKEALTKALELKIESSKNIIELLKIKSRLTEGDANVFISTTPSRKAGIDINNLKEAVKNGT